MNRVSVIGSINMDMIISVDSMPKVGETIFSDNFKTAHGGKGANQAVASKRLGNEVYMISKIGEDASGREILKGLEEEKIISDKIFISNSKPTGTAVITVNKEGNNSIMVIPGANMDMTIAEINECEEIIKKSDILVAQFETPIDVTTEGFKIAKEADVITILNPAPAKKVPDELLQYTDFIIPNETEAKVLTGVDVVDLESAKEASKMFLDKGVKNVIITMGEKGAALVSEKEAIIIPAYKVKAVDTTAAGDSFIGGLTTKLIKDYSTENLIEAIKFGNKVSSIVVQREGAQPSIPYLSELTED